MRILALETDPEVIKKRFCHHDEHEVLITRFHSIRFLLAIAKDLLATTILIGIVAATAYFELPFLPVFIVVSAIWVVFVFFDMLKAYIDWAFDFIWVTTDKIVLIDQTSILRQEIKPIHIENIGGISTATQLFGMFSFGIIRIHLKEGLGGDILTLKYVANAEEVAGRITEVVTRFQRRDQHATQWRAGFADAEPVIEAL